MFTIDAKKLSVNGNRKITCHRKQEESHSTNSHTELHTVHVFVFGQFVGKQLSNEPTEDGKKIPYRLFPKIVMSAAPLCFCVPGL